MVLFAKTLKVIFIVLTDTERRLRGYRTLPRGIEKSPSGGRVRRRRFFSPPWARPRARRQFFPDTHLVSQSHARQFLDPPRLVFPNFPPSPRIFSMTLLHSSRRGDENTRLFALVGSPCL